MTNPELSAEVIERAWDAAHADVPAYDHKDDCHPNDIGRLRYSLSSDQIKNALIASGLPAEVERLKGENTSLRAALSVSKEACVYCQLTRGHPMTTLQDELASALRECEQWMYDYGNPIGTFERIADAYYRDTGHLRPGKDCRTEDTNSQENNDRFSKWCVAKQCAMLKNSRDLLTRYETTPASTLEAVRASPECICPRCGLRHGHIYPDGGF